MRFKGIVAAALSLKSAPRPGTNVESTTPGDTANTRTWGANALAKDLVKMSKPALAAA
jgi:hypothetical protein